MLRSNKSTHGAHFFKPPLATIGVCLCDGGCERAADDWPALELLLNGSRHMSLTAKQDMGKRRYKLPSALWVWKHAHSVRASTRLFKPPPAVIGVCHCGGGWDRAGGDCDALGLLLDGIP
jgi:hypothetical protein